jgi:hypothetical protein
LRCGPGSEIRDRIGSSWLVHDGRVAGTVCCAGLATAINLGTIEVRAPGRQAKFAQLVRPTGSMLKVAAGTLLRTAITRTQFAGARELVGTFGSSDFRIAGGALTGSGAIEGNLANEADLSPRQRHRHARSEPDFRQATAGSAIFDLTSGTSDPLQAGTASLGGAGNRHNEQSAPLSRASRKLAGADEVAATFAIMTGLAAPVGCSM